MIHREQGELVVECADCEMSEFGGTLEFQDFVEHLKDAGWNITKEDDEWIHRCPDCTRE